MQRFIDTLITWYLLLIIAAGLIWASQAMSMPKDLEGACTDVLAQEVQLNIEDGYTPTSYLQPTDVSYAFFWTRKQGAQSSMRVLIFTVDLDETKLTADGTFVKLGRCQGVTQSYVIYRSVALGDKA